jgi:hypothetical protein
MKLAPCLWWSALSIAGFLLSSACGNSDGGPAAAGGGAGAGAGAGGQPGGGAAGDGGATPASILDVFFGLDHALPATINKVCPGGGGLDGIPVTFSRRVVGPTVAGDAFRVTTMSGAVLTPKCATLTPATDNLERFTVLLVGDLGTEADPPVRLEVVGSVPLDGGLDARGLSSTHVTPLLAGPELLLAFPHAPGDLAGAAGAQCPSGTAQIVLVAWMGGVSDASGQALGSTALPSIHVTFAGASGSFQKSPIALGGVGDNDNFVQLCLDETASPVSVQVEAGVAHDPRGDPNPSTTVAVTADTLTGP